MRRRRSGCFSKGLIDLSEVEENGINSGDWKILLLSDNPLATVGVVSEGVNIIRDQGK